MDPDEILRAMRDVAQCINEAGDGEAEADVFARGAMNRLAELFTTLDESVSNGGVLPTQWRGSDHDHL